MANSIQVTYLMNSGFMVASDAWVLVFDYFQDATGLVAQTVAKVPESYFFVSHAHADHYNQTIARYNATRYFLSSDIRRKKRLPADRTTVLPCYSAYNDERLRITTFASTDEGTSFYVQKDGWNLFHAGDFNWWHWDGDTDENNAVAKRQFVEQLQRMRGLDADIAFFPVDGRLGRAETWGAREFCANVNVHALVAMHRMGYPPFRPGDEFFPTGHRVPCWPPVRPGETLKFNKESGE